MECVSVFLSFSTFPCDSARIILLVGTWKCRRRRWRSGSPSYKDGRVGVLVIPDGGSIIASLLDFCILDSFLYLYVRTYVFMYFILYKHMHWQLTFVVLVTNLSGTLASLSLLTASTAPGMTSFSTWIVPLRSISSARMEDRDIAVMLSPMVFLFIHKASEGLSRPGKFRAGDSNVGIMASWVCDVHESEYEKKGFTQKWMRHIGFFLYLGHSSWTICSLLSWFSSKMFPSSWSLYWEVQFPITPESGNGEKGFSQKWMIHRGFCTWGIQTGLFAAC